MDFGVNLGSLYTAHGNTLLSVNSRRPAGGFTFRDFLTRRDFALNFSLKADGALHLRQSNSPEECVLFPGIMTKTPWLRTSLVFCAAAEQADDPETSEYVTEDMDLMETSSEIVMAGEPLR